MPENSFLNMIGMFFSHVHRIQYFKLINNKTLISVVKCFKKMVICSTINNFDHKSMIRIS